MKPMARTSYTKAAAWAVTVLSLGAGLMTAQAIAKDGRDGKDFGWQVERMLDVRSQQLFGIREPLERSADDAAFTGPGNEAVLAAEGLTVELISDRMIAPADMMVLLPDDEHPTHAIACVENFAGMPGQPSVQRVNVVTGDVEVVLRGIRACDPVKRTPWGTVVVAEESGPDGRLYEILDPMHTTEANVLDRASGTTDHVNVAQRPAMGSRSWEGIVILPSGTVYMGDELRPSSGKAGGAITKFVPATPWTPGAAPIGDLTQSPLVGGAVYALRLGARSGSTDYGQGSELGDGKWIAIDGTSADAAAKKATGYYRPEDMELDPIAWARDEIRLCWANTGRDESRNYGAVLCLGDEPTTDAAFSTGARPTVQLFAAGMPELAMPDNLVFQPKTGILYVMEDGVNEAPYRDDVWACLPDGADRDTLSDGCIRVLSWRDPQSEPTGMVFTADGQTAYIHVMHRDQTGRPNPMGYPEGTDDLVKITGFQSKLVK
jgi:hypothetical protein